MQLIYTEHLLIRRFTEADAPFIVELLNTPAFLKYIGDREVKCTEDAITYLQNGPLKSYEYHGFGLCLVALRETNKPIGMCGLIKRDTLEEIDIGFAFLPEYEGKGYAYECALAVLNYGLTTLGLKRIVAITSIENPRSVKLLERLGFRFEKIIRLQGSYEDLRLFTYPVYSN